jgi:hypothetical protein
MTNITQLCWDSYFPILKRIVSARASANDWNQLDKLLLEDYEDLENSKLLETLLRVCVRLVATNRLEDRFYNAVEDGLVDRLFSLQVWERDSPQLYLATSQEAAKELGACLKNSLHTYVSRLHDYELFHCAYEEFYRAIPKAILRRHAALRQRMERRCKIFKEELIAAAWHPARVSAWLDAGLELEDL